jgi:hypothetical protein
MKALIYSRAATAIRWISKRLQLLALPIAVLAILFGVSLLGLFCRVIVYFWDIVYGLF